jgi:lactate permease
MVGPAYATRSAGLDTIIGKSLARTGRIFPRFGSLVGRIGVDPTVTGAGSNARIGNLQNATAGQLHLSPFLMGCANSAGEGMGKMISPRSLVVAAARANQPGQGADMVQAPFRPSILLASLGGFMLSKRGLIIKSESEDIR